MAMNSRPRRAAAATTSAAMRAVLHMGVAVAFFLGLEFMAIKGYKKRQG